MVHGDEDWWFNLGPRQMNDMFFANICFFYCMTYYSKARTWTEHWRLKYRFLKGRDCDFKGFSLNQLLVWRRYKPPTFTTSQPTQINFGSCGFYWQISFGSPKVCLQEVCLFVGVNLPPPHVTSCKLDDLSFGKSDKGPPMFQQCRPLWLPGCLFWTKKKVWTSKEKNLKER